MNTSKNLRLGIILMIITSVIFSIQDALSQHLAKNYNTPMIVMIRFWVFSVFALVMARQHFGSVRRALHSVAPKIQILRSAILSIEICVMVSAFTLIGLVESHAVFACYPLLITALSARMLGEDVGWRRWSAIGVGFLGVLVILKPSGQVFSWASLVPLASAGLFALYGILTRYVGRVDAPLTSLVYTGLVGVVITTAFGIWWWEPMARADWGWMAFLSVSAVGGHYALIKCYEYAEASAVQPFAYLQLVFASAFGVFLFGEDLRANVVWGALIVSAAGIFTLVRSSKKAARL